VGASQGILGLISYMGAAAAGIPLSFMQVRVCRGVFCSKAVRSAAAAAAAGIPLSFMQVRVASGRQEGRLAYSVTVN
jgi:sugar phosphate permease